MNYPYFSPEAISSLKAKSEMTVPLLIDGNEIGEVTVIADDVGLKLVDSTVGEGVTGLITMRGDYIMVFNSSENE